LVKTADARQTMRTPDGAGSLLACSEFGDEMVHVHCPHWASQLVSDVEHQGAIQMIGLVFALILMIAPLLFAVFVLMLEIALRFH